MHTTMRYDWLHNREQPQIKDIIATGSVDVKVVRNGSVDIVPVNNLQFVPDLSVNFLSVSQIVKIQK